MLENAQLTVLREADQGFALQHAGLVLAQVTSELTLEEEVAAVGAAPPGALPSADRREAVLARSAFFLRRLLELIVAAADFVSRRVHMMPEK